nr:CGGC domain-containing protein [Methanohalobium sp.]
MDEHKSQKIAVVRCETVSEVCPGVGCFKAFNNRDVYFRDYNSGAEIMAFFTCGGCSGRRVYRLVKSLKKQGVDIVHLSSCMMNMDNYPECPHIESMKKTIKDNGIEIVEGTHH